MEEKDPLLFLCKWERNRQTSWSGTHQSLFSALEKQFELIDVDWRAVSTASYKFHSFFARVLRKLFRTNIDYGEYKRDVETEQKYMDRHYGNGSYTALQFTEYPIRDNIRSYFYCDLTVDYVCYLRDSDPDLFMKSGFEAIDRRVLGLRAAEQTERLKNKFKGVFTMSAWLRNHMIAHGFDENKVHHVGGGCNLDASRIDGSQKSGNKILFVGRDFERKNGPFVIEAFKRAKQKRPDIKLYVAGPNISENIEGVVFLGPCSYEELIGYFNLCDIFCMPSLFEAYGLVFVEALTFGLPCIGRNAYEMPYMIKDGETGYLLKEQDAAELADAMLDLLSNQTIKNNVLDNRQFYLQNYSWDATAKRIAQVIQSNKT